MYLGHDQLLHMPVVTTTRRRVGKIIGFRIDPQSQSILQYDVRVGFFGKTRVVHRSQVITITEQSMVIDDALVTQEAQQKAAEQAGEDSTKEAAPALSSEIE